MLVMLVFQLCLSLQKLVLQKFVLFFLLLPEQLDKLQFLTSIHSKLTYLLVQELQPRKVPIMENRLRLSFYF